MNCPDLFFGNFLPLETAEVDREDHKEHLPKTKLPKIIVSAAQIGNWFLKWSQNNQFPAGNCCELDSRIWAPLKNSRKLVSATFPLSFWGGPNHTFRLLFLHLGPRPRLSSRSTELQNYPLTRSYYRDKSVYAWNRYNVANRRSHRETVHLLGSRTGHFQRFGTTKIRRDFRGVWT